METIMGFANFLNSFFNSNNVDNEILSLSTIFSVIFDDKSCLNLSNVLVKIIVLFVKSLNLVVILFSYSNFLDLLYSILCVSFILINHPEIIGTSYVFAINIHYRLVIFTYGSFHTVRIYL